MSSEKLQLSAKKNRISEFPQTDENHTQKDEQHTQNDEQRAQTDEQLAQTDEQLAQTDEQLAQTDEQLAQTDEQLAQTDEQLTQKDDSTDKNKLNKTNGKKENDIKNNVDDAEVPLIIKRASSLMIQKTKLKNKNDDIKEDVLSAENSTNVMFNIETKNDNANVKVKYNKDNRDLSTDVEIMENFKFLDLDIEDLSADSDSEIELDNIDMGENLAFTNFLDELMVDKELSSDDEQRKSSKQETKKSGSIVAGPDPGHYVDTITGEVLDSSGSSGETDHESLDEEEGEEEEKEIFFELPEYDEEIIEIKPDAAIEEEALKQFFYAELTSSESSDGLSAAKAKEFILIQKMTFEFIYKLINSIVRKLEYVDPEKLFRQNINTAQLMKVFSDDLWQLESEQRFLSFLNRFAVDFYRKKKMTRFITADPIEKLQAEIDKNVTLVQQLDELICKENAYNNAIQLRSQELHEKLHKIETTTKANILEYENLIINTTTVGRSEKFANDIAALLRKQSLLRDEISENRFYVILKVHTLDNFTIKLDKLETIGPDVHMSTYICLQNEVMNLEKKNDELNNDFTRRRNRFDCEIHKINHLREKEFMLSKDIQRRTDKLNILIEKQRKIRELIHKHTLSREKLRETIKQLHFDVGILHKPMLMHHYDEVQQNIKDAQARYRKLVIAYATLTS